MKKILFLGAAPTQIPPITYALDQGHYVITCDYLPDNPGHRLAHESHNISTTDERNVLELSRKLNIDAVVAYASDPAAPTAAYVAEQLGLPGNPYKSVKTLARKDLFRKFLKENGFNVPRSSSFFDLENAKKWIQEIGLPAFIKPVDSSGSKGVTEVTHLVDFDDAFKHALKYSRKKKVIIEERILKQGYQVAGDGFVVDGNLVFRCWADEHFDDLCNGLVPIGQTFPTSHSEKKLAIAHSETQRLLSLLGMRTGALNFDFVFTEDDEFFFLELGPRNGGCLIPEVIKHATGVDLIKYTVDAALGIDCAGLVQAPTTGYWSSYMIHALEDGTFKELSMSKRVQEYIVESYVHVRPGDQVSAFGGSNDTLGTMILKFPSRAVMLQMLDNMEKDILAITH